MPAEALQTKQVIDPGLAVDQAEEPEWLSHLADPYSGLDPEKLELAKSFIDAQWSSIREQSDNPSPTWADIDKIKEVADIAGCNTYLEHGPETEQFMSMVEGMTDQGLSSKTIMKLIRNRENSALFTQSFSENPTSVNDPDSPIGLAIRLAKLPIYDLAPEGQEETYYANGQGTERDVRDSIVVNLVTDPSEYKEYVALLEQKVPALEDSGFPLEIVGKTLLDRFNPSVAVNRDGMDYETKLLDYCTELGGSLSRLRAIDEDLSNQVVNSAFRQIISSEKPDIALIERVSTELSGLEESNDDAYGLFNQFKAMGGVRSLTDITKYITMSRRISESPALYGLVKDEAVEESNGLKLLPPYLSEIDSVLSLTDEPEELEAFFTKCNDLEELFIDNRIDSAKLLRAARALEGEEVGKFIEVIKNPSIQEAYSDPQLAKAINESLGWVYEDLENSDLVRAVESYKRLDNQAYFELPQIVRISTRLSRGKDGQRLNDIFYDALGKASTHVDKNGFPYDGVQAIEGMIDFIARTGRAGELQTTEYQTQLLEWFERSELPYSALPAIVSIRKDAISAGINDTPDAIHEWMFEDSERVKDQSRKNLVDYIGRNLGYDADAQDIGQAIEQAKSEVNARQESFRLLVNIGQDPLLTAVHENSGNLKALFDRVEMQDRGYDRGMEYALRRSGVEIALGIRSMESDEQHPIYGSSAFIDKGVPEGASGYGGIVLVFKPDKEFAEDVTFTPEDSFHGALRLTMEDAQILRHMKDSIGRGYTTTDDYVEAQIKNSLSIVDAEQIVVTGESQADELRAALPPEISSRIIIRTPQEQ